VLPAEHLRAARRSFTTPLRELHHNAARLAVCGANVNAIQRIVGHAPAAMTLDIYASAR